MLKERLKIEVASIIVMIMLVIAQVQFIIAEVLQLFIIK
jgi:hypothetical protein